MTEKDIYNLLKKIPFTWTRIETTTVAGIPDVNYFDPITKTEGWIELKVGSIRLRPAQVAWHHRALKEGRMAFVLSMKCDMLELYQAYSVTPVASHFAITDRHIKSVQKGLIHSLSPYLTKG